jgi:hypothetical protein
MSATLPDLHLDPAFAAIVAEARALSVEFGTELANHLPMVLWAQHRLGGDAADAARFAATYLAATGCRPPAPSPAPIKPAAWTERLGDRRFETAYRVFFATELERLGQTALLARYLPTLVPGIAASALHALMRLAYALDADSPEEVATALAYAATTFLPLGQGTGAAPRTADPGGVLALMADDPAFGDVRCESPLLWHFMRRMADVPAFFPVHDWLEVGPDTIARMARDSLRLYAATMDFSALHAVTGTHWLRLVLPHLDQTEPLIRAFWQAIAALYPKIGFQAPLDAAAASRMAELPCPDWATIARAAVASSDEHDLSLVYSARVEQAEHGDRLYQVVAARRLGLIA